MGLGRKLKKLRITMKKTLKDASEIFNVSINSVYRWEHELTTPRRSSLKKIADFYNVPMKWLLSDNDGDAKSDLPIMQPETNTEQQILKIVRKLSDNNKYKILGYVERICVEDMDETEQKSV
jgi:transcriptional regulator with XRE-family HTH domain